MGNKNQKEENGNDNEEEEEEPNSNPYENVPDIVLGELSQSIRDELPKTFTVRFYDDYKFEINVEKNTYEFVYHRKDVQEKEHAEFDFRTVDPCSIELMGTGNEGEVVVKCLLSKFKFRKTCTEGYHGDETSSHGEYDHLFEGKEHFYIFKVDKESGDMFFTYMPDISSPEFNKHDDWPFANLNCDGNVLPSIYRLKKGEEYWSGEYDHENLWKTVSKRYFG